MKIILLCVTLKDFYEGIVDLFRRVFFLTQLLLKQGKNVVSYVMIPSFYPTMFKYRVQLFSNFIIWILFSWKVEEN